MPRCPAASFVLVLLAAFTLLAQTPSARTKPLKAVRFGTLVDGKGKVWKDAVVVISGDKVQSVTADASQIPADATVIDLRRFTGIPGLIDVHTHMTYCGTARRGPVRSGVAPTDCRR